STATLAAAGPSRSQRATANPASARCRAIARPIPPAAPVTSAVRCADVTSLTAFRHELRRAFLPVRRQPFPDLRAAEPDELQAERRLERGLRHPVPVIQAVLG